MKSILILQMHLSATQIYGVDILDMFLWQVIIKNKRFYSHDLWNLPDLAGFAMLGKILYVGGKICSAMM